MKTRFTDHIHCILLKKNYVSPELEQPRSQIVYCALLKFKLQLLSRNLIPGDVISYHTNDFEETILPILRNKLGLEDAKWGDEGEGLEIDWSHHKANWDPQALGTEVSARLRLIDNHCELYTNTQRLWADCGFPSIPSGSPSSVIHSPGYSSWAKTRSTQGWFYGGVVLSPPKDSWPRP